MIGFKSISNWSRFQNWRLKNMQERYYILLIAILIGMFAGLATVILKSSVHFVKDVLVKSFARDYFNVTFFIFPVIGIFIVLLIMKFILKQQNRHGIVTTLYAIAKRKGIMKLKTVFGPLFTSAITVGFGGSAGVEGPAVASGSAIGSYVSQKFKLNFKQTGLLLSCGAAGAMASSLNAPITGMIFTLEVLMLDLTSFSILPLLAASISGVIMTRVIYGGSYLIPVSISGGFDISDLPFYLVLGLITGLISIYFERMFWFIEDSMQRFKNIYTRFLIGSVVLGFMIFLVPALFGEGYDSINYLLSGDYARIVDHSPFFSQSDNLLIIILLLVGLALFKVIATSLTVSAGGVGGVVAPSIFTGATIGFVFAKVMNLFDRINLNETNYTLVGMAGVFAGILHAPLTAIFLIAELTGGYTLMIPLMITVILSYLTVKLFVPHSIYNRQLAQRKELLTHHKDKVILQYMNIDEVIETNFSIIRPRTSLGEIVKFIEESKRNIFPVVNEAGHLEGIVYLDKIRQIMFNRELYNDIYVEQLMTSVSTYIDSKDHMETVMDKFNDSGAWNLPVLENGIYRGFLSKSVVLSEYRKKMVEYSDE
jgi:CIC family chloride channel protein